MLIAYCLILPFDKSCFDVLFNHEIVCLEFFCEPRFRPIFLLWSFPPRSLSGTSLTLSTLRRAAAYESVAWITCSVVLYSFLVRLCLVDFLNFNTFSVKLSC